MRLTRTAAVAAVLSCLAFPPAAGAAQRDRQTAASPARPAQGAATAADPGAPHENADQVRNRLEELLRQYPSNVGHVLAMDPTLIDNPAYLEPYPELSSFLAAHAEVKHNPAAYYTGTEET